MLKLRLGVSWVLAAVLVAAHGGVIALILLIVEIAWWVKGLLAAALALNLALQIRLSVLLRTKDSVIAIEDSGEDTLVVETRRGERIECDVLGTTFVSAFMTILNLKAVDGGQTRNVAIFADAVNADDFRKLRIWLRWKAGGEQAAEQK